MKKLIKGILDFKKDSQKHYCEKFSDLATGQSPHTLLISCCDSRVVPNIFTAQDPGDLFVLRNIGNLVPPYQAKGDSSVAAALEYSVFKLKVANIVVCGHSGCGAMAASLEKELPKEFEAIKSWLEFANPSQQKLEQNLLKNADLTPQNRLSQINVVQQLEHLKTYPYITERIQNNELEIHGIWFDLKTADVYKYEQKDKKFALIK